MGQKSLNFSVRKCLRPPYDAGASLCEDQAVYQTNRPCSKLANGPLQQLANQETSRLNSPINKAARFASRGSFTQRVPSSSKRIEVETGGASAAVEGAEAALSFGNIAVDYWRRRSLATGRHDHRNGGCRRQDGARQQVGGR